MSDRLPPRGVLRRLLPAVVLLLLLLLPLGALAADDGANGTLTPPTGASFGYGHVFPAPDPSDPVDVPAPFPAQPASGMRTRQVAVAADPQPTFAPVNDNHVYVAAKDSKVIPSNITLFRCDGAGDEREINDAIAAAQGGVVELLDGSFRCAGRITLAANTTLVGQGSANTTVEIVAKSGSGYLPIGVGAEYVNVGGFTLRGNGFVMITRSHVRVRDITATCIDLSGRWRTASGNGMFFVWVAPPVNVIDDVEFYECSAIDCHTHGFNMNQDYNDGVERTTSNIRFLDCRAVRCGYGVAGDPGVTVSSTNQSRSEWITGFDLQEWQDLVNLEVVNCVAEDNWESGFHLEPGARYDDNGNEIGPRTVTRNVSIRNCVSSNNGQRNTYRDHFFMSGYYLSRDTHLEDCQSFNNRNCGYYVHAGDGSSFVGCTDDGSTYGFKVCKASEDITIADCTSANNRRWAMWLAFSQRIRVTNFRHSGVVSDRGYQSILGWYKDESQYQLPVTDSSFEITAVNNGMPIINRDGSRNTYALHYEGDGPDEPVATAFSATPVLGDAPLRVQFTDGSTGATVRCWDFGDGNISAEQNPLHVYGAPGNYTVSLIAANDFRYDTETKPGHVSVMGPVTASFSATPTLIPVGASVRFTDASTGNIFTRAWTFGDGGTSTATNPVHAYAAAGTYTISLTVANAHFSNTKTVARLVTVGVPANASFVANRTAGASPLAVGFTDTSAGSPTSWAWSFGDGATSTAQNPVHTYTAPGTYDVRLTAANALGSDGETRTGYIAVAAPPPAVVPIQGTILPPTDTDGDGVYDDLNGNGRLDFADVVLFFSSLDWIAAHEPLPAFDCNDNGRIDFADVSWIFARV
ncbi:MAG: PKD domain-containing protein [Methanospirillum sp.]